ncbi:MAG: FecR domain-containing protein [SAR324 cluster bacterium]
MMLGILTAGAPSGWSVALGQAEITAGSLVLVRSGAKTVFASPHAPIAIEQGDVLLVQSASQAVLKAGKGTLTLGANTVFQVQPWEFKSQTGYLRLLFGKFRASVVGLSGGESFNIKTATATIGVKGTEFAGAATAQGDVVVLVTNSVVQMTGQSGPTQSIAPGQVVVALNAKETATAPALPPPELKADLEQAKLDSPPVSAAASSNLPEETALVRTGIVTQKELFEAKLTQPDFREAPEPELEDRVPEIRYKLEDFPAPKIGVGPRILLYLAD